LRRLPILGAALATLGVILGAFDVASTPAAAQEGAAGRVSVIKVVGLIDPVMADFISRSIVAGEDAGVVAVVLQMNSPDAVVSDARLVDLARQIHEAEVPVTVWIGPSGSSARGGAAQLAGAAQRVGIAPGSRLGKTGDLVVPDELLSEGFLAAQERLRNGTVGPGEAFELGITATEEAPVIGEFLIDLPGFESAEVEQDGRTVRQPVTTPVFSALPVQDQLFHTVASPAVAYLLLLVGLSLIIFEFFTAGVGVAGLVGAGSLVLSAYGLAILPVRPVALALILLAMFGFSVDVQTGVARVWSGIGVAALIVGSFLFYDGFGLSWITLLVGIGGTSLAMIGGMPAMVRTRFSTPTIGREWMIGEEGEAITAVSPDGVVLIRGAKWRARTNRATPIPAGDPVRVIAIEGLVLEVEPEEGGARDYRERGGDGA
jgi:membrane-bound serine protease (ClpP class)